MNTPRHYGIDRKASLANLVDARDILGAKGVPLYLNFGTLLGALREKDFIPHDYDTDSGTYWKDREKVFAAIPELEKLGFEVAYVRGEQMLKLARGGEDLDIFFAKEQRWLLARRWNLEGHASVPSRHLDSLEEIDFLGERFKVPADPYGFVRNLYGRDWMVPIADRPSRVDWLSRARKAAANPGKTLFYAKRFVSKRLGWAKYARDEAKKGIER